MLQKTQGEQPTHTAHPVLWHPDKAARDKGQAGGRDNRLIAFNRTEASEKSETRLVNCAEDDKWKAKNGRRECKERQIGCLRAHYQCSG